MTYLPDAPPLTPAAIVARDGPLFVVDKPPGYVSSGPALAGRESVESWLARALGLGRVWAVHQLDRDTSGLNLFVTRKAAVAVWAERLKAAGAKRYLAITRGVPPLGRIEAPIGTRIDPLDKKVHPAVVAVGTPEAKASATEIIAVTPSRDGAFALVEARPLTGRTHQVRVHLAHVGCPIVGDRVHGARDDTRHPRHALHAWRLAFPASTFVAPLPLDLVVLCDELGLAWPPTS